ncbi:MAG: hypothetical protein WC855_09295 [Thermodesulfovibrionales bacterium]
MKNIAENIIFSYEARIQSIGDIFDNTHLLLRGFQDSFLDTLDTKQEREKFSAELRENLAKNESLRRKDFDNMMQGILSTQDEREKEVRSILKNYLNEHKEMAFALKENLSKVKDALARGEVERVKEFHEMIKEVIANQDARKEEVTSKLKELQKEQQEMVKKLKELLAKGRDLRIKDFKAMLEEFNICHKERLSSQEKRREKVQRMLGNFKKKRVEVDRSLRVIKQSDKGEIRARAENVSPSVG